MGEKKVFVGDEGQRATVNEEDKDAHTEEAKYTQGLVTKAGAFLCPNGADYLGSATVHYYSKKDFLAENYFVACQCDVRKVSEGHADIGWKQLRSALMKAFGRKEPSLLGNK